MKSLGGLWIACRAMACGTLVIASNKGALPSIRLQWYFS